MIFEENFSNKLNDQTLSLISIKKKLLFVISKYLNDKNYENFIFRVPLQTQSIQKCLENINLISLLIRGSFQIQQ